jgi:hypothetical protein
MAMHACVGRWSRPIPPESRENQGNGLYRNDERRGGRIQGQVLRLNERRVVVIFLRDGALWIADFIDGHGELVESSTWFRFNCAAPTSTQARRRMVLEAGMPLTAELVERIERLLAASVGDARGGERAAV